MIGTICPRFNSNRVALLTCWVITRTIYNFRTHKREPNVDFMFLGYNTNGFAHHDLLEAIAVIHDIGYRGVGITIDHHCLNPLGDQAAFEAQLKAVANVLQKRNLRAVIETGCRFLLDSNAKHEPTLVTADRSLREVRQRFLKRAIDVAVEIGADAVSLWSGVLRDNVGAEEAFQRLCESLKPVVEYAETRGKPIAFEPEPGMVIDTMEMYARLREQFPTPFFQLTIDVGHLHCQGETPILDYLRRFAGDLANVHIEDMVAGVHEHLMFGQGEMDFPPILQTLADIGYANGVYVELSRHSHMAPQAAEEAYAFLRNAMSG